MRCEPKELGINVIIIERRVTKTNFVENLKTAAQDRDRNLHTQFN
jgi:hypothetical protein